MVIYYEKLLYDVINKVLFDLRVHNCEKNLKMDFNEGIKNFKSIMENYINILSEIRKAKFESPTHNANIANIENKNIVNNTFNIQQFISTYDRNRNDKRDESGLENKESFVGQEDEVLNKEDIKIDQTRRRFTKNLIRKVGTRRSSTLLDSLWNTLRTRKFGSFADMNDKNIISNANDQDDSPLFKRDKLVHSSQKLDLYPKSNLCKNEDSYLNIHHKQSTQSPFKKVKIDTQDNIFEEENDSDLDSIDDKKIEKDKEKRLKSSKFLKKIQGGGNRLSIKDRSPLNNVLIASGSKDLPRGIKASLISQGSFKNSIIGEEQIQEIKQLKSELTMYKTHNDMLTKKFQGYSSLKKEVHNILDKYEQKNREIYKMELENLKDCFSIYRGYYEEELSSRRQIIDDLCKIIDDMKLK